MCGLPVTRGSRNGSGGTNGSSSAVMISAGNRDAIDHAHRAGAVVVVAGAGEAVMRRGVTLVEFADRPDRAQRASDPSHRETPRLAAHAAREVAHEVPLIDDVLPALDGSHAGFELDDRRHGARRPSALGGASSPRLAGELQREVAAERVARQTRCAASRRAAISSRRTNSGSAVSPEW